MRIQPTELIVVAPIAPGRAFGAVLPALHSLLPVVGGETTLCTAAASSRTHGSSRAIPQTAVAAGSSIIAGPDEVFDVRSDCLPSIRDVRVISLIGVAHGVSHYYQLAFVTMLLIVRQEPASASPTSACWRASSTACRASPRRRRASRSTASARGRSWPAACATVGCRAGADIGRAFVRGLCRHRRDRRAGQLRLPSRGLRAAQRVGDITAGWAAPSASTAVGGSLGWAAAPVMYFLDSMFGWVGAALIGALPGLVLSVLVWAHRTRPRRPSRQGARVPPPTRGTARRPCYALPAARDPALPRLLRPARGHHRRHPAVRRAGLQPACSASAKTTRRSA